MRPALLRLLKRPSAVSILDTLAATPVGIEQLESKYRCLRCSSRSAKQELPDEHRNSPARHTLENPNRGKRPFSFPIYDIEEASERSISAHTDVAEDQTSLNTAQCSTKALALRPDRLEFESDVGHLNNIGTRLVDSSDNRYNLDLWEELLRYRQRHYGDNGTLDIWEGLTIRVDGVRLPIDGEQADFFWQSFVDLGLRRRLFLKDVFEYAVNLLEKSNSQWPGLYERIVGGLLEQGAPNRAVEWHKKLQDSQLASPNDALKILPSALRLSSLPAGTEFTTSVDLEFLSLPPGLKAFQAICSAVPGHQFYGPVIAMLMHQGHGEAAILMHYFLAKRQDHPQTPDDIQPLLDYVEKFGLRTEFNRLRGYVKKRFDTQASIDQPGPKPLAQRGEKGQDEKPFKDDLGAKLFATRALNFDMVVGGLKMLGVSEIGPRTLRELATRTNGNQDLLDKLKILKQSGISVGNTVFSRLIQKLAAQNRDILLSDILRSDQHPDILEDRRTQESMLYSYYMARDWRLYNMTLAILTELYPGAPDLYDIHFRKHIAAWELGSACKVADELALQNRTLGEESVDFMAEQVLTPRRMNHRPPPGQRLSAVEEVVFMFKILKRVVPAGGYVSAAFWVEMLKRLGMADAWADWDKLEQCCRWLVSQYADNDKEPRAHISPKVEASTQTNGRDRRMLDLVFTPQMQAAIVSWGFMFRVLDTTASRFAIPHPKNSGEKLIPWVRGLILLRELEQSGLRLDKRLISQAVRHRLAMLYSHHVVSARRMNRMLRRRNPYHLQQVMNDVFQAWGDASLFDGMEQNLAQLVNPPRSARSKKRAPGIRLSRKGL
ncbi:uncharacterized protein N7529_009913 [Penicillium soppii]|jgi:hypothetical protein|uniref:uncharacterized protein n=1 Tax=Penicillium soppii TaxID=69789 RepID=UPI002546776F|nr:uncharacterized protein N7529_009913 [Penicillium soppii]KAJ5855969.1 hypothetical protein N7529_009913 [Penicillium soppii]